MTKLKAFASDKLNVAEMKVSPYDREENTVGKRIKCWLPALSPFPTVFSKVFFSRVVKSRDCGVKIQSTEIIVKMKICFCTEGQNC